MSIQRNVIANYLSSGWSAAIGLAFTPLYIRHLGIESYGLIGFFATLQAWLFLLDMGFSATLNREVARHCAGAVPLDAIRKLLKSMEVVYALAACTVAVLVASLAGVIGSSWLNAQSLSTASVTEAVVLMGLAVSFQWMAVLYRGAILGLQHQVWLSVAGALTATFRAAGAALVLAFVSPDIRSFLLVQCAVGAAESAALGWYLHTHLSRAEVRPRFSIEALRSVWRFAGGIAMVMVLATIATQLDKLLLARLLPLQQFGYFSLALTVAGALSLLVVPISNVAYPRLSEMVANGNEQALAGQYHRFAQLLSIGIVPPALLLCLFSETVVLVWTGDSSTAQAVAPVLSVWVVGTAINGILHVPYAAQIAHGWPRLSAILNAAAVILMIPALLVLVPVYGAMAAAWIWVCLNVGYVVIGVRVMHTRILVGEKSRWYLQDVLAPLAGSSVAALVLWTLHPPPPALSRMQELAFLCGAAVLLAIGAALAAPLGRDFFRSLPNMLLAKAR